MRVTLPPGLAVSGISEAPGSSALYVSAAHAARDGGISGLVMLEYDGRSGWGLDRLGLAREAQPGRPAAFL
jgi:hypothetical protein